MKNKRDYRHTHSAENNSTSLVGSNNSIHMGQID